VQRAIPCKEPFRAKSPHGIHTGTPRSSRQAASTPTPPQVDQDLCGGRGRLGYLLIQCIAYQMHCLSNALLIKCIAYQMHCLLNALLIKCVGYSMVVKHCRRTHPFSLSLSIHRHLAYLPPARPTHTPPPHQARRPSHSSPALLSGTPLRVCAGVRERGRACSRPCNALAMERSGDPTYWPHRRPRTPRQAADTHTATSQAAGRATPVWVWGRESGRVGYLLLNVCAI